MYAFNPSRLTSGVHILVTALIETILTDNSLQQRYLQNHSCHLPATCRCIPRARLWSRFVDQHPVDDLGYIKYPSSPQ